MSGDQIGVKRPAMARRRRISHALKQQIVDETNVPGASVSAVARKHDVNANQLFKWRRRYSSGAAAAALVSVSVRPDPLPKPALTPEAAAFLEVDFPNGHRLRIHGRVDRNDLRQVIELLR